LKTAGIAAAGLAALNVPLIRADDKGAQMKKAIGIGLIGEKNYRLAIA